MKQGRTKRINFKEKGITLVALVVTIIILLILAGVTIAQIGGNNGLFSRVRQAVDKYKNASINEELAILEIEKYVSDFTVSEEEGALVKITKVEVTAGTDTITIKVTVEGNVSKIEYSKDNEKTWQVKEGDEKSTEYIYEEVAPGSYFIKVRATDENGKSATATSDVVTVNPIVAEEMATEKEVIEGKKFITGEGIIKTGSMANRGLLNWSESNRKYTVPSGYYTGGTIDSTKSYSDGYNDGYSACTKTLETNTYKINKTDNGAVTEVTYTANISKKSSVIVSLNIASYCPYPNEITELNWSTNSSSGTIYGNCVLGSDYVHGNTSFVSQIIDVTGATYFTVKIPVNSNVSSTFTLSGTIKFS